MIKANLAGGGNDNIPDVKFLWAKDFDDAARTLRNANWPQVFWQEGKSYCRIIKLMDVFDDSFYVTAEEEGMDIDTILSRDAKRCFPVEQKSGDGVVEDRPKRRRRRRKAA